MCVELSKELHLDNYYMYLLTTSSMIISKAKINIFGDFSVLKKHIDFSIFLKASLSCTFLRIFRLL